MEQENSSFQFENFKRGFKEGLPIAIAYFPISMAFAVDAAMSGLDFFLTQIFGAMYTGSGQGIFLNYFKKGETIAFMYVLMLFIANFRYAIFSIAMSQKFHPKTKKWQKYLYGVLNTDEVYVLAMQNKGLLKGDYLLGLAASPFLGYFFGTILGALVTGLIPPILKSVLGIMLHGLFIAMVIPNAKKSKKVLYSVLITAGFSLLLEAIPAVGNTISSWGINPGAITMITCALLAAVICAILFPIDEEETNMEEESLSE